MTAKGEITIEGFSPSEWGAAADDLLDGAVLTGDPLVFRTGTAQVLARVRVQGCDLLVELAHIDGGGEGVLLALRKVAKAIAKRRGLVAVEWIVYAANCAKPNPRLRRVLEKGRFELAHVEGKGEVYRAVDALV